MPGEPLFPMGWVIIVWTIFVVGFIALRMRRGWEWNGQAVLVDETMNDTHRINIMAQHPPMFIEYHGVLYADEGRYDEKGWRIYTNSYDVHHAKPQPAAFVDTPEARERLAKHWKGL